MRGVRGLMAGFVSRAAQQLARPGLGRNMLAITDQALTALSSFVLLLYLSRTFSSRDFGAYSFAFALFFMVAAIHNAVLTEPMLVFGATRYKDDLRRYLSRVLLVGNTAFGLCVLVSLLVVSMAVRAAGSAELGDALLGIAVAGPLSLLSVLMRRACYLQSKLHLAVISSALYFAAMLASMLAIGMTGALSLLTAALPMAVASAAAVGYLAVAMPRPEGAAPNESGRAVMIRHLSYARWSASSESIHWLVSNLPVIALPIWFGFEASATFKILNLLYMPLYQIVHACMTSLIPHLARTAGRAAFTASVRSAGLLWVALAGLYGLVLTGIARPVTAAFYGSRYEVTFLWLILLIAAGVFYTLANVHFAALRARQRPDCVFKAYLVLCAILIAFVPLYPIAGMTAVICSLAVGWAGACVVTTLLVTRVAESVAADMPARNEWLALAASGTTSDDEHGACGQNGADGAGKTYRLRSRDP